MNSPQAKITQLMEQPSPLLSVEFFPPKTAEGVDKLLQTAQALQAYSPDFVSVTYGAGGSTRDRSAEVSRKMKSLGLNVMPHLTCVGATRNELGEIVDGFYGEGYRNIMTLRGDPPKGKRSFVAVKDGFAHASDLVSFIKERQPEMCLGVAGYPEKHAEAASLDQDLDYLKFKVDQGASFITTQLFFDNAAYYAYVEKARAKGIELPIVPGLMPALSLEQIKRIAKMCAASLPQELESKLAAAGGNAADAQKIGIEWATSQLVDLLENAVGGVHLYALNTASAALEMMQAFRAKQAA